MSAPQQGYPTEGYPQQDPYGQQQPQYPEQPQPGFESAPPQQPEQHHDGHGKTKKKNRYAAQAFEFGTGGNVPPANAPQAGPDDTFTPAGAPAGSAYGGFAPPVQPPTYAGNQPYLDNPPPASQFGASAMGGLGGYQAPEIPADQQGYPGPGAPGVAGITQRMGGMAIGGPQTVSAPGLQKLALNQLYPTDLLNQPFQVAELQLPPPPIILPANVCDFYV